MFPSCQVVHAEINLCFIVLSQVYFNAFLPYSQSFVKTDAYRWQMSQDLPKYDSQLMNAQASKFDYNQKNCKRV